MNEFCFTLFMQLLLEKLRTSPVVYVTRDIERALGLNPDTEGYFIISNSTSFAKQVAKTRKNILLIPGEKILDTFELLDHEYTKDFINNIKNASILVFKNTKQIEQICQKNKWPLLNPSAELSNTIEEKISQVKIFAGLKDLFLKYNIVQCKDIKWTGKNFILQFNHAHTGSGTVLIDSEANLKEIQKVFPNREARISDFIDGPMFTNNNVINGEKIMLGNISYQITGLKPFTEREFSTIGNDWGLAKKILTPTHLEYYKLIVLSAGAELKKLGWKGLFGVDAIMDPKTGKIYLVEINARQPASVTYESWLQDKMLVKHRDLNTFEAHLATLLGIDLSMENITVIEDGAQIIQRVLSKEKIQSPVPNLVADFKRADFNVVRYDNTNVGSELLRIQSTAAIMEAPNKFNRIGEKILNILLSNSKSLSGEAMEVVHNYLYLPIGGKTAACPYFNNARIKARGGLRVFTGKGSIEDILEEISILEKKQRIDLSALNEDEIKKFLVDNNIGIDCSGFVYHVLDAELRAQNKKRLSSQLSFHLFTNFFRRILARLRAVQNTNVLTLAQPENSSSIKLKEIKPGDMIIMLQSGQKNDRDHVLLIDKVNYDASKSELTEPISLNYVHSFAWSKDGKYNHGTKQGKITFTDTKRDLLAQTWQEDGKTSIENETYQHAKQAKLLDIRRLNALM